MRTINMNDAPTSRVRQYTEQTNFILMKKCFYQTRKIALEKTVKLWSLLPNNKQPQQSVILKVSYY